MGTEPLLQVRGLGVRQKESLVIEGVDLDVWPGQFVSLIGPNGAGKSTLLKAVLGILPVVSGQIQSRARRIGYVPQHVPFDHELPLTVSEFLSLRLDRRRLWRGGLSATVRSEVVERLEEIGAGHLVDRRLGWLSGGEFQRVLIAYALIGGPDLLLLDEPLTGVDIRGGKSFDALLHHLHEERGMAILMVSHDLHLVEHQSDVVYCINNEVCCHGSPEEVLTPHNLSRVYGHLHETAWKRGVAQRA